MEKTMKIELLNDKYIGDVEKLIIESWSGPFIAVHRQLYDLRELPCIVALLEEELLGYCYYRFSNNECEIMAIESIKQNIGVGTALIYDIIKKATEAKCKRVYLETTNDNTHAFRFYQRRGFTMIAYRIDEMHYSRQLKPSIPLLGEDDIPIKDEIEFELLLYNS